MESYNPENNTKDNLDFNCEYCNDRLGGCAQCGWSKNEHNKQEEVSEEEKPATEEDIADFFKETKQKLDDVA